MTEQTKVEFEELILSVARAESHPIKTVMEMDIGLFYRLLDRLLKEVQQTKK